MKQTLHEPVGCDARPRRFQHAVEVALRAERTLDLVEAANGAGAVDPPVLLVEPPEQVHPESLTPCGAGSELLAGALDELADLALLHPDERPLEP